MFQNFAKNIGKAITITVVEYLQASCCLDELGPFGAVWGGQGWAGKHSFDEHLEEQHFYRA